MATSRWWSKDTVAVVTGANKGIGLEIARQLSRNSLTVVLTARSEQRGRAALQRLKQEEAEALAGGANIAFHPLDVQSPDSVTEFSSWLKQTYNRLDILVNNAAVIDSNSSYEDAKAVLDTNYYGVKRVTKELLPIMKASESGARIVNVSSSLGQLELVESSLREGLANPDDLTEEKIDMFVHRFLQDVQAGNPGDKGWPAGRYTAYCVSKLVLNAYTRVLAKQLNCPDEDHHIYVNCMHPGFVATDMNDHRGNLSVEEGADTAVWLALLPAPLPTGEFFYRRCPYKF